MKKSLAFTLGEVLIALAVIGVVAALIIPMLINGHKAGVARAQFDTAYSMVSKTIAEMDADNVSVEPAKYMASRTFYSQYKKYNRIAFDCSDGGVNANDSICAKSNDENSGYQAFNGRNINASENQLFDDGCLVATNGMMFCVENPKDNFYGLLVTVDINGKNKKPNRLGYDVFSFEIVKGGYVLPVGAPDTGILGTESRQLWGYSSKVPAEGEAPEGEDVTATEEAAKTYCDKTQGKAFSGITCAYDAAMDKEYFKKLYQGH